MKKPDLAEVHAFPGGHKSPALVLDYLRREADKIARVVCVVEFHDGPAEIRMSDMTFDQTNTLCRFFEWAIFRGWEVGYCADDDDD